MRLGQALYSAGDPAAISAMFRESTATAHGGTCRERWPGPATKHGALGRSGCIEPAGVKHPEVLEPGQCR